jgi:hypothetical protein
MPEPHKRDAFLASLLAQDRAISSPQLKEFRSKLQELLDHAERTERRYRKLRGVSALITCIISFSIVPLMYGKLLESPWVMGAWFTALLVSTAVALGLTWAYNGKFLPRVERTRNDLQVAIVNDLQQQVADLSRRLMPKAE